MNLKLHFQRFELKYLIGPAEEAYIKNKLGPYLIADPFTENAAHPSYEVWSLYYDSPLFYYYFQKKDGVADRKKVRLRTYRAGGEFMPYFFIELKRRHDAAVLKDRLISKNHSLAVPLYNFRAVGSTPQGEQLAQELEYERLRHALKPQVLVAYEREPYLGRFNPNFRLTFDRNIRAIRSATLIPAAGEWASISRGQTVLEIKFTATVPQYVTRVIQNLNLERVSFSKYCEGVDACGLANRYKISFQNRFPTISEATII